ncbi:hypothetical protein KKA15_01485 [Patescibacteria group bacterium]|nr:hypothetical protein [Patescibacteria group bacterium]
MKKKTVSFSLDGISGTGKSQILRLILGFYQDQGCDVFGFFENLISPERQWLSEEIDKIRAISHLQSDQKKCLEDVVFTANASEGRAYLTDTIIRVIMNHWKPNLMGLDRWYPTNMAYQSLRTLTLQEIFEAHLIRRVFEPDLHILLTCPPELAVERVDKRTTKMMRGTAGKMSTVRGKKGKIDISASLAKKQTIQDQILKIPEILGSEKCLVVDTSGSFEEVLKQILPSISVLMGMSSDAIDVWYKSGKDIQEVPFDNVILSG